MLAEQNEFIDNASSTVYQLSQEESIRLQCEAREDYYRRQRSFQHHMDRQEEMINSQQEKIDFQQKEIATQQKEIASQQKEIATQKEEIDSLRKQLNEALRILHSLQEK